jgi:hypothetical protein
MQDFSDIPGHEGLMPGGMAIAAVPIPATLLTAGVLGLVYLAITLWVVARRAKGRIMIGDGGDADMLARIRAHANFNEYVPFLLLLMAGIELSRGHGGAGGGGYLWGCGAALVLARIAHAIGMVRPAPNPFRALGALVTWTLLLGLSLWAIWLVLAPPMPPGDYI